MLGRSLSSLLIFAFSRSTEPFMISGAASSIHGHSSMNSTPPGHTMQHGNILLLDHLNINHRQHDHPTLLSFYQDTLGCVLDSRKSASLTAKKGTVWANAGATQFHLSEGQPDPQVLDGKIHVHFTDDQELKNLQSRAATTGVTTHTCVNDAVTLHCPYGNVFVASVGKGDPRFRQPATTEETPCRGIHELTLFVADDADLPAISRFYNKVFNLDTGVGRDGKLRVPFGPFQTVTFEQGPMLNQDYIDGEGPHVSFYVDDLSATWSNVIAITSPCSIADSLVYANPRFKKQARTLEEALDQCIFRVLHVVDPLDPSGVVMRLEHEITSRIKPDGSIYENFPAAV